MSGSALAPEEPRPSGLRRSFLAPPCAQGFRPVGIPYLPPAVLSATPARCPVEIGNDVPSVQVGLSLSVDVHGRVSKVAVTRSGGAAFDEAATLAAARFVFRPALRRGTPVRARLAYTMTFKPSARPPV